MTDEVLMRQAREGREEAFLLLYGRYRDPLYRFAFRLTGQSATAEDLVHDCFLALIRSPERFAPELGSLRTYLYASIRNLSHKHFRGTEREDTIDEIDPAHLSEEPLQVLLSEELAARVQAAIAELPLPQREVLVLCEYEDFSQQQAADLLGVDVGAVKSRLHRARARLRHSLAAVAAGQGKDL
jgi:RNA polymerase sigma-70 factor (ECF subfamily)